MRHTHALHMLRNMAFEALQASTGALQTILSVDVTSKVQQARNNPYLELAMDGSNRSKVGG